MKWQRHHSRALCALALSIATVVGTSVQSAQAAQTLARACNLGPRGDACAYIMWDARTSSFVGQGAVNPNGGHTWRIDYVTLQRCYTTCTGVDIVGPSGTSTSYQFLSTSTVRGSRCYTWHLWLVYTVDGGPKKYAAHAVAPGIC